MQKKSIKYKGNVYGTGKCVGNPLSSVGEKRNNKEGFRDNPTVSQTPG